MTRLVSLTRHDRNLAMKVIKKWRYRHRVVIQPLAQMSGSAYGEAYDRAMILHEKKS
jgi:hypothetical protein